MVSEERPSPDTAKSRSISIREMRWAAVKAISQSHFNDTPSDYINALLGEDLEPDGKGGWVSRLAMRAASGDHSQTIEAMILRVLTSEDVLDVIAGALARRRAAAGLSLGGLMEKVDKIARADAKPSAPEGGGARGSLQDPRGSPKKFRGKRENG